MRNVDPDINHFVQDCFEEALAAYAPLHDHTIHLRRKYLKDMTMRARPVVNGGFFRKKDRAYRVDIQDHTRINESVRVPDLPQRVLVGWFAHELGHVMDYHQRSWPNLIRFGLGYWLFPTFRVGAERKADLYAIEYGFAEAITATKEFLLTESYIPNSYKDRLTRYYMTTEEVELMVKNRGSGTIFRDRII